MRFWLRWAIVTLPLAVCLILWGRSYVALEGFSHVSYHEELTIGASSGKLFSVFMRAPDWKISEGRWTYNQRDHAINEDFSLTSSQFLGFGYGYQRGPGMVAATIIEVPMWAVALLVSLPPLWLYRRHRKRRKIGFPVEPVTPPTA
jgi:hypothetical protein